MPRSSNPAVRPPVLYPVSPVLPVSSVLPAMCLPSLGAAGRPRATRPRIGRHPVPQSCRCHGRMTLEAKGDDEGTTRHGGRGERRHGREADGNQIGGRKAGGVRRRAGPRRGLRPAVAGTLSACRTGRRRLRTHPGRGGARRDRRGHRQPAKTVTISTANISGVGTVLTTSSGLTLYRFTEDKPGTSTCTGACAKIWPPLLAPKGAHVSGPHGVKGLTLINVGDGHWQVAFHELPLYRFEGDKKKGQAHGQNVGGEWFAVLKSGIPASATVVPPPRRPPACHDDADHERRRRRTVPATSIRRAGPSRPALSRRPRSAAGVVRGCHHAPEPRGGTARRRRFETGASPGRVGGDRRRPPRCDASGWP